MPHDTDAGIEADAGLDVDAGAPPHDAGEPGPHDACAISFVDWTSVRGTELTTTTVRLDGGTVYAARANGFLRTSSCDDVVCDYDFFDATGARTASYPARRGAHLRPPISYDGQHLLLVNGTNELSCGPVTMPTVVAQGTLELISVQSGQVAHSDPSASVAIYDEPTFMPSGRLFHTMPSLACSTPTDRYQSTAQPFADAPGITGEMWGEEERPDGGLIVFNGSALGVVDPATAGSYREVVGDADHFTRGAGWLHAFERHPVRKIVSIDPHDVAHVRNVSPNDMLVEKRSSGRWVILCRDFAAPMMCRAIDARGEFPDRSFHFAAAILNPRTMALIGGLDEVLFHGRTAIDLSLPIVIRRLDLRTGVETTVLAATAELYTVGEGSAAMMRANKTVTLFERETVTTLATDVEHVLMQEVGIVDELPQRQSALFIVKTGGQFALKALHLRNRKLVTLTADLEFIPKPGNAYVQDNCASPWITRQAGPTGYSIPGRGEFIHFMERAATGGDPALLLVPIDLSAPPRVILRTPEATCHRPLVSVDGSRTVLQVDQANGEIDVVTAPLH